MTSIPPSSLAQPTSIHLSHLPHTNDANGSRAILRLDSHGRPARVVMGLAASQWGEEAGRDRQRISSPARKAMEPPKAAICPHIY